MKRTQKENFTDVMEAFWQMYAGMSNLIRDHRPGATALWSHEQLAGAYELLAKIEKPQDELGHLLECSLHWKMVLNGPNARYQPIFGSQSEPYSVSALPMAVGQIEYSWKQQTVSYFDIVPPAPMNILRYVFYQREHLSSQEKLRTTQLLSTWIKATEDGHKRLSPHPELREDELTTEVALALAELPEPPRPVHLVAETPEQADEAAQFLFAEHRLIMYKWCLGFAKETALALIRNFSESDKQIQMPESLSIEDIGDSHDAVQQFHNLEEARRSSTQLMALFTERERQAMLLRADDLTYQQIAQEMSVGVETVNELLDRARSRVCGKLPPSQAFRNAARVAEQKRRKKS